MSRRGAELVAPMKLPYKVIKRADFYVYGNPRTHYKRVPTQDHQPPKNRLENRYKFNLTHIRALPQVQIDPTNAGRSRLNNYGAVNEIS